MKQITINAYSFNELEGKANNFEAMGEKIRQTSGARFFQEEKQHFAPKEDFDLCLNINHFNFVLKGYMNNNQLEIKKINI